MSVDCMTKAIEQVRPNTVYRDSAIEKFGPNIKTFTYFRCLCESGKPFFHHDWCPACESVASSSAFSLTMRRYRSCNPFRRIRLHGWLWWKVLCPIAGVHHHYKCTACNSNWICFPNVKGQSEAITIYL